MSLTARYTPSVSTPQQQRSYHDSSTPLATLAMHGNTVVGVLKQPFRGLLHKEEHLRQQRRRVILEGDPLDLVEEHLCMIVAYNAVGGHVGVTEVEHLKTSVVPQREEAADNMDVIAVTRLVM
jgi:hypothetical protein